MPAFTWYPDAMISSEVEPKIASARFGDGYEMRATFGINSIIDKWQLTFTGNISRIQPIEAFLVARGGFEAFDWVNPDSVTGRYVCRKWTKRREMGEKVSITAEFERVFGS